MCIATSLKGEFNKRFETYSNARRDSTHGKLRITAQAFVTRERVLGTIED